MNPKKALYFSMGIRMLMVFFCISICFVKFIESDDETKVALMEQDKKALVDATRNADVKKCEELMNKSVTLDGVLADGSTPLHLAALNSPGDESFALLKKMLGFFGDPRKTDHLGRNSLHMACINTKNMQRRNDTVGLLLLYGADVNTENSYGRGILADLVTLQSVDNVLDFIAHWGWLCTPKSIEQAKELAGYSAGVGLGYTDVYQALLKKPSLAECVEKTGMPEIIMHVLKGEWEVAFALAEKNNQYALTLPEKYGNLSLLFIAILRGEKKLIEMLLNKKDIKIDYVDEYKRNILHIIAGSSSLNENEKILLLDVAMKKGAQSVSDALGNTIIHTAVKNGNIALLIYLKEHYKDSVEFAHRNTNGDRPVDIAIRYGKSKFIELLGTE